jgi:L-alanine-DL-glutamate epimerase-like enolase superfamily enzyme
MKIKDIRASLHRHRFPIPFFDKKRDGSHMAERRFVYCEVETDDGLIGSGFTANFLLDPVVTALERNFLPVVKGMDPRNVEAIHDKVGKSLNQRTMTGVVSCALSALDIALWDIQGKSQGLPVAQLLGGHKMDVPAYITFGLPAYDRDQLVDAAKAHKKAGFTGFKMVAGRVAGGWREDVKRVKAVREAVGPDAHLMVDANYAFTPQEAKSFCQALEEYDLTWFEEPVAQNDAQSLADLRRSTSVPLAAGQAEGHRWRLREFIDHRSVDVLQPNVAFCGGFTEARKVAHLAQAYNLPIANGGGLPLLNMHLLGAMSNGWLVEWHVTWIEASELIFKNPPRPKKSVLSIPNKPGLGLEIDRDGLKECRVAHT